MDSVQNQRTLSIAHTKLWHQCKVYISVLHCLVYLLHCVVGVAFPVSGFPNFMFLFI